MSNNPVSENDNTIEELWTEAIAQIASINSATENWKAQTLPLARIKKIMKIEEGVLQDMERERLSQEPNMGDIQNNKQTRFMIAGEAPVLLGKACELLIKEISARAWRHTERNRRRTLQRQDVHAAVGESEVFDFLIDIVPRLTTATPQAAQTTYAEHHMAPPPLTGPQDALQMASMVQNPQPDLGSMGDNGVGFGIPMHALQDPQVPMGYEQYYMQMHQARLQAEAAVAPPIPHMQQQQQVTYVTQDAMGQWGHQVTQSQQHHQHLNNGQPPGPGV